MTVFDVFAQEPYTFLSVKRGTVRGNTISSERELTGIFKKRISDSKFAEMGIETSAATLHAHPEDFLDHPPRLGDGVRVGDTTYSIVKISNGTNFETGELEHLTFTLEVASYA